MIDVRTMFVEAFLSEVLTQISMVRILSCFFFVRLIRPVLFYLSGVVSFQHKRKRNSEEPVGDSERPLKRMRRCDEPQVSGWSEDLSDIDPEPVDFPSELNFDSLADESFSDVETVVLEWEPPLVEAIDTDRCVKVRFADEIPVEVLEAHLRHHASGRKGISPVVRYWCMCKFSELCPGAPCFNFDLV